MATGENSPTNNETDSVIEGDNPWQKMAEEAPLFNPEQKQSEPSPSEIINTLYNRYANQLAKEEANRDDGFPSLSETEFADLQFCQDLVGKVFVQEGAKSHDKDFSYASYFGDLMKAARDEYNIREDGAEVHKFNDEKIFITTPGVGGYYEYGTGSVGADELFSIIGVDKNTVSREQLLHIVGACDMLANETAGLERSLDYEGPFGRKIRSRQETATMVERREQEERQEKQQKQYEEDIEKYGPVLYAEKIITHDKLDKYEKEKSAYISSSQVPRLETDGAFTVGAPDTEKIKEFDELIESEKRKIGEERDIWKELHFENGETHAYDAVNELEQFINSLTTQIDDAEKSGAFASEKTVHELKRKQAAAKRLARKLREYSGKA